MEHPTIMPPRWYPRALVRSATVDAATIIAIALLLAAYYCMSKIVPHIGFRLLFPPLSSFTFPFWVTSYYPWTDLAENVYLGFALAHGWPIYEAGASGHMPGVPQYLAVWLWMFGFGHAAPSPQTAASAYLVACLATVSFQAACVYAPMRMLAFSRLVAAVATLAVCASTAFAFHFAMPMSETLIAYLMVLVPVLAARMIFASAVADRLAAAIWLGGPVTLICLLLGLTVAPANALVALACLMALVRELTHERASWRILLHDSRCLWAYGIFAAVALAAAATMRTGDLYLWAVDSNLYREMSSPLQVLRQSFGVHARNFFRLGDPIGSRYPDLLAALILFAGIVWMDARHDSDRNRVVLRLVLFGALIAAAAILTQWRQDFGYRTAPVFGLTVGVMLLATTRLPRLWRAPSQLWLLPLWAMALGQVMFLRAALAHPTQPAPVREAAFEKARICRLDQTEHCRCVQGTVYGPQIFLLNDMRPCPNRFSTFHIIAPTNPQLSKWILEDARNPAVAFWTHESDALMLENGVPPEVVRYLRTEARCEHLANRYSFCFARE